MTDRNVILPVTARDFSQYGAPSWAKFKIIFRKDSNYEDFRGTKFYRTEEAAKNALTKKDKLIEKTKLANLKPKAPPKADKFLIIGSAGKLKYRTGAEVLSDIGAGNGDITRVSITTDSGSGARAQTTSGDANFELVGVDGAGVTNSG